jgi:hypothetical protein
MFPRPTTATLAIRLLRWMLLGTCSQYHCYHRLEPPLTKDRIGSDSRHWSALRALRSWSAYLRAKCQAGSEDFDQALADIFSGKKPNQGCRQILEAIDNILAHLELAALDPSLEICQGSLALRDEVHHQEALEG